MDVYEVRTTRQAEEQMAEVVRYLSHELLEPQLAHALLSALEKPWLRSARCPSGRCW